jgi:hypothetical protein
MRSSRSDREVLFKGSEDEADGKLRLTRLVEGAIFDRNPSRWAPNNKMLNVVYTCSALNKIRSEVSIMNSRC